MEVMFNNGDNMILRGDEDNLILDNEVANEEEVTKRSLRAKEDEEMLIHPLPNRRRNCETRVWTTIPISVLLCLCFYFELHVVLFVMFALFCQSLIDHYRINESYCSIQDD
ncbi:unnamed protein product [Cuscuta epithymum]|uniref:Transmembrane protein n=1 Tax=Cuscuta epithymum TaxID=186058 RepID=A0AAV0EG59_9ASTE|nr:unnamed protein product [Cuscuta epithymum]